LFFLLINFFSTEKQRITLLKFRAEFSNTKSLHIKNIILSKPLKGCKVKSYFNNSLIPKKDSFGGEGRKKILSFSLLENGSYYLHRRNK